MIILSWDPIYCVYNILHFFQFMSENDQNFTFENFV